MTTNMFSRTEALLGCATMKRLADTCVAVAGLGGSGGSIAVTLARLGVGSFRLADPGRFDEPDFNRQFAATRSALGLNKSEVYEELIRDINPNATVAAFRAGIRKDDIGSFLDGANVLVDALDVVVPWELRAMLTDRAREQGLTTVIAPLLGFGTILAIAAPDGMSLQTFQALLAKAHRGGSFPKTFQEVYPIDVLETVERKIGAGEGGTFTPTLALTANLVAAIVSTEILMLLSDPSMPGQRPPIVLPQVLLADTATSRMRVVDVTDL